MAMANQGVIKTAAFSLYLNDLESQGNILFGGYDQAKYVGDLQTVGLLDLGDYEVSIYSFLHVKRDTNEVSNTMSI